MINTYIGIFLSSQASKSNMTQWPHTKPSHGKTKTHWHGIKVGLLLSAWSATRNMWNIHQCSLCDRQLAVTSSCKTQGWNVVTTSPSFRKNFPDAPGSPHENPLGGNFPPPRLIRYPGLCSCEFSRTELCIFILSSLLNCLEVLSLKQHVFYDCLCNPSRDPL